MSELWFGTFLSSIGRGCPGSAHLWRCPRNELEFPGPLVGEEGVAGAAAISQIKAAQSRTFGILFPSRDAPGTSLNTELLKLLGCAAAQPSSSWQTHFQWPELFIIGDLL